MKARHHYIMTSKSFLILLCAIALLSLVVPQHVLAATDTSGAGAVQTRLHRIAGQVGYPTNQSLPALAGRVVRVALVLIGAIFFIITVYGGFLYLTAGGNEEQVTKAKKAIMQATIGLLLVVFAGAIAQFVSRYIDRPQVTSACSEDLPEYVDTSFFGGCPTCYSWIISAPDETGISGAACRRD